MFFLHCQSFPCIHATSELQPSHAAFWSFCAIFSRLNVSGPADRTPHYVLTSDHFPLHYWLNFFQCLVHFGFVSSVLHYGVGHSWEKCSFEEKEWKPAFGKADVSFPLKPTGQGFHPKALFMGVYTASSITAVLEQAGDLQFWRSTNTLRASQLPNNCAINSTNLRREIHKVSSRQEQQGIPRDVHIIGCWVSCSYPRAAPGA